MHEKQNSQTLIEIWKGRLQEWSFSGKNIADWCRDQNVNYHRFIYWKGRLNGKTKKKKQNGARSPIGFVELNEDLPVDSGIVVEFGHVLIHLSLNFHEMTFLQCLRLLKDNKC